jgi:hypothetical protein
MNNQTIQSRLHDTQDHIFFAKSSLRHHLKDEPAITSIETKPKFDGFLSKVSLSNSQYALQIESHRFSQCSQRTPFEVTILDTNTNRPVYDTPIHKLRHCDDTFTNQSIISIKKIIKCLTTSKNN